MPASVFVRRLSLALLTLGGIGFVPAAQGTLASFVTIVLLLPLLIVLTPTEFALVIVLLSMALFWLSLQAIHAAVAPPYDRRFIVIDEVIGMSLSLLPLVLFPEAGLLGAAAAFVSFRFFDIVKPFGIRRIDALGTPLSVLTDDLAAGAYAALVTIVFCVGIAL